MKAIVLAVALALSTSSTLLAQAGDMKGMDMKDHKGMDMKSMEGSDKKGEGQVHKATGKVTKIDRSAGAVTIAHDPVPSMKWPSMTMAFKVKDKAMLEKLKSDAKVDFSFMQSGKDYVITDIK
jgi:Cu(I)/Ag(I) efflux system periplasmic protein CusF